MDEGREAGPAPTAAVVEPRGHRPQVWIARRQRSTVFAARCSDRGVASGDHGVLRAARWSPAGRLEEGGDVLPRHVGLVDVVRRAQDEACPAEGGDAPPDLAPDLLGVAKLKVVRRPTVPQSASRGPKRRRMRAASMCSGWTGLIALTPISTRSSRIGSMWPSLW